LPRVSERHLPANAKGSKVGPWSRISDQYGCTRRKRLCDDVAIVLAARRQEKQVVRPHDLWYPIGSNFAVIAATNIRWQGIDRALTHRPILFIANGAVDV